MVPAPPEPAVAVADTIAPEQTAACTPVGDKVPDTGTALTVTVIVLEVTAEQTPLVTLALKYLVTVNDPTSAIVKVVVFVPRFVKLAVNPASSALCHWIVPVALAIVILLDGELPEQIVWFAEALPTAEVGFTVTVIVLDVIAGQTPLVTTALKYFVPVKTPTCAVVKVVAFVPRLIKLVVNPALSALCHWIVPVALAIVTSLNGELPEQIVWSGETVPTDDVGLTVTVTEAQFVVNTPS